MPGLLGEIRDFLRSFKNEAPELFGRAPKLAPPPKAGDRVFHERAAYWSERMGIPFRQVRVKRQRSRWGSASAKKNLNFNRRLLLAPPAVLDYVVIHELAHLREMNHSRRFWAIVAAHCPEHKVHRRWLREHGPALMRKRKVLQ